jgi:hypothetical protein
MMRSTLPRKLKKEKSSTKTKVSAVYPLTKYAMGKHYYSEYEIEDDKTVHTHRSLGNDFRGGYFLLEMLSSNLPLGSAIRVTFEVIPANENREFCNLEERDKLTDTHHHKSSVLPTAPVSEGGTGDPSK